MHLTEAEIDDLATSYLRRWEVSSGTRAVESSERKALDVASDRVDEAANLGTLPIELLDAMIRHDDASPLFRFYVAAGPMEVVLADHAARYGDDLARRCRSDARWTETLSGVWLSRKQWKQLPAELRRVVPEPKRH